MKILAVSDEESEYLWDYKKQKFDGIDLILSCGDLDAEYLSFWQQFLLFQCYMSWGIMMINIL